MQQRKPHPMWEFRAALDAADIDGYARGVGKIIAWIVDQQGECYFGRAYLERNGIRQVRGGKAIQVLIDAGLLERLARRGPHGSGRYRVVLPADRLRSPGQPNQMSEVDHLTASESSLQLNDFDGQLNDFSLPAERSRSHSSLFKSSSSSSAPTQHISTDVDDDRRRDVVELALDVLAQLDAERSTTRKSPIPVYRVGCRQLRQVDRPRLARLHGEHPDWTAEQLAAAIDELATPSAPPARVPCDVCRSLTRCEHRRAGANHVAS